MKHTDPVISVIIPVYNIEQYIEECVESVLAQTYKNLQIILVDDGSTDRSGQICDSYKNMDSRITVIHQENQGVTAARRKALDLAIGEYIGFVDGDDFIEHDMYRTLLDIITENQLDFVHSGYCKNNNKKIFGVNACKTSVFQSYQDKIDICKELLKIDGMVEIAPSLWSKLFRRKIIINEYNKVSDTQTYGEDLITVCRCVLSSKKFAVIPNAFYHYRSRRDSITKKTTMKRVMDQAALYQSLEHVFCEYCIEKKLQQALENRVSMLMLQDISQINNLHIPRYKYPEIHRLFKQNIILYGAGNVGRDFYQQISQFRQCNIVAWVDRKEINFAYAHVIDADNITQYNFDKIVLGVNEYEVASEIQQQLIKKGIPKEVIEWIKPALIIE